MTKTEKLAPILNAAKHLWIVLQDYPDPDAIASAAALCVLARQRYSLTATVVFGGMIGRVENRALSRYLDLPLRLYDDTAIGPEDCIALLDTQPGTGNNCLPDTRTPQIVIDHHPVVNATRRAAFTDIRRRCGATSTILYEYLVAHAVELTPPLATALLYGIRSDTQDLGRESTHADLTAILALFPIANTRMYHNIRQASVATPYFRLLADALKTTWLCGPALISLPGKIETPDAISEIADLLLRHEQCRWALCIGFFNDRYLLSLRTIALKADAGKVIKRLVRGRGTGGGHRSMAGGQIGPSESIGVTRNLQVEQDLMKRFFQITARGAGAPKRLLDNSGRDGPPVVALR